MENRDYDEIELSMVLYGLPFKNEQLNVIEKFLF